MLDTLLAGQGRHSSLAVDDLYVPVGQAVKIIHISGLAARQMTVPCIRVGCSTVPCIIMTSGGFDDITSISDGVNINSVKKPAIRAIFSCRCVFYPGAQMSLFYKK